MTPGAPLCAVTLPLTVVTMPPGTLMPGNATAINGEHPTHAAGITNSTSPWPRGVDTAMSERQTAWGQTRETSSRTLTKTLHRNMDAQCSGEHSGLGDWGICAGRLPGCRACEPRNRSEDGSMTLSTSRYKSQRKGRRKCMRTGDSEAKSLRPIASGAGPFVRPLFGASRARVWPVWTGRNPPIPPQRGQPASRQDCASAAWTCSRKAQTRAFERME